MARVEHRTSRVFLPVAFAVLLLAMPQFASAEALGNVDDNVLEVAEQSFPLGWAVFGPLFIPGGETGNLQLGDDGGVGGCANPAVEGTPTDGCEQFPASSLHSKIALLDRGCCLFVTKVRNAQAAGALAVVIMNNQFSLEYQQPIMQAPAGDDTSDIQIPSGMISFQDGQMVRDLTDTATARKLPESDHPAVLAAWLSELGAFGTNQQLFSLASWVLSLSNPQTDVLKASHSRALWNKLASAFKQYNKGNVTAGNTHMDDFKVLAGELAANGEVEPLFAETMIAAADLILDGVGM